MQLAILVWLWMVSVISYSPRNDAKYSVLKALPFSFYFIEQIKLKSSMLLESLNNPKYQSYKHSAVSSRLSELQRILNMVQIPNIKYICFWKFIENQIICFLKIDQVPTDSTFWKLNTIQSLQNGIPNTKSTIWSQLFEYRIIWIIRCNSDYNHNQKNPPHTATSFSPKQTYIMIMYLP